MSVKLINADSSNYRVDRRYSCDDVNCNCNSNSNSNSDSNCDINCDWGFYIV